MSDTSVKVAVRIRPLVEDEASQDETQCINANNRDSQIVAGSDTFSFDHVFGTETSQSSIYNECVDDLVNAAFEGFNATILAYGQTGSGKTYTMGSSSDVNMSDECIGIIPRVIKNIFQMVEEKEQLDPSSSYKILVQFLEIYGEDIKDLLDQTKSSKVSIRETPEGEVFVSGAKEECVNSYEQMMKTLEDGTKHRTTAATRMNATSSRSHAIFTVIIEHTIHNGAFELTSLDNEQTVVVEEEEETDDVNGQDESKTTSSSTRQAASNKRGSIVPMACTAKAKHEVRKSKFHFVDLAGSERAKRTGAQGQQLKEGIDINKGLLALGNVISALGDEQKRGKVFVPYRDSKLTRMLQDSLGGNSKTLMICCVSPSILNFNESLNALRYANRARNIKNKPVVNRDPTLVMIDELKQLLKVVSTEVLIARKTNAYVPDNDITNELLENLANSIISATDFNNTGSSVGSITGTLAGSSNNVPATTPKNRSNSLKIDTTNEPFKPSLKAPIPHFERKNTGVSSQQHQQLKDELNKVNDTLNKSNKEMLTLKNRVSDADNEVFRLTTQLKNIRQDKINTNERCITLQSELEFYKMKWYDACPKESSELESLTIDDHKKNNVEIAESLITPHLMFELYSMSQIGGAPANILEEKKQLMEMVSNYIRENEQLNELLAKEQKSKDKKVDFTNDHLYENSDADNKYQRGYNDDIPVVDEEFSSNVVDLIEKTKEQLQQETDKLKQYTTAVPAAKSVDDIDKEIDQQVENALAEENDYMQRQRQLSIEVADLGQSIYLKEQLVAQLQKSHDQYTNMKSYYEQKLIALSEEMKQKESEREVLLAELQELSQQQVKNDTKLDREKKLREELKKKDDELKIIKRKQDGIHQIGYNQSRYMEQMTKLERDINTMKKQRVDLAKTLQNEKKNHMIDLSNKAKEIERLKREVLKYKSEAEKLQKEKDLSDMKAREAIKVSMNLRKKTSDLIKAGTPDAEIASTRAAMRVMSKVSRIQGAPVRRAMNDEEINAKKWLEKRIGELKMKRFRFRTFCDKRDSYGAPGGGGSSNNNSCGSVLGPIGVSSNIFE